MTNQRYLLKIIFVSIASFSFAGCTVEATVPTEPTRPGINWQTDSTQPSYETADQSQEPDWYYIGEGGDGNDYYADLSRESVDGSYWTAPALLVTPDNTKALGRYLIDCSDLTYKTQFANFSTEDWAVIGIGSPLASVAENVCVAE